jgi:hypothetical protein
MTWDRPPLSAMTDTDISECAARVAWLLEREKLLPRELYLRLETWRNDLRVEVEDRAAGLSGYRQRV